MLIIDFYNLVSSSVHRLCNDENIDPTDQVVRTTALNSILVQIAKHPQYSRDGVIIAFDNKVNWRSSIFPLYKQNRKKRQEKRDFDYQMFYTSLEMTKAEFRAVLPYKCIEVEGAEADDVISVLSRIVALEGSRVCIVSNDKDFIHLQTLDQVGHMIVQFSPLKDKMLSAREMDYSLDEHIVGGDSGDGIPNVFSVDDVFLRDDIRQKPFTASKKAELKAIGLDKFSELQPVEVQERIERNRILVDLTRIPPHITDAILQTYVGSEVAAPGMLFEYMTQHQMATLIERFGGSL